MNRVVSEYFSHECVFFSFFSVDVPYVHLADDFPMRRTELWCRDGVSRMFRYVFAFGVEMRVQCVMCKLIFHVLCLQVHLSDDCGMPILAQHLWIAAYRHLATPPPEPRAPGRTSPGSAVARRPPPQVVVKGEAVAPRQSDPFDWSLVERRGKVIIQLKLHDKR